MANATSTQLQELYVAYFGRAADPTGLDYWTAKGITTAKFASDMYAQAEFKDAYGSLSTESQVNQIYKNLFDREADVTGLTYWTQQIKLGNLQLAEIANDLIWAAQNNAGSSDDKTALTNRTNAAVAYTAEVKLTTSGILAYQAETTSPWKSGVNITEAINYLSGIDKDTAYTAAGITTSVNTIKTNGVPTSSAAFNLTAATAGDDLVGTSGNDTFTGGSSARFQNADTITGGAGTDTLNTKITGDITATIDEVENIILDATAAASLDGANVGADTTSVTVKGGNTVTYKSAVQEEFTVSEAATGLTVTALTGFTNSATNAITVNLGAAAYGTISLGDEDEDTTAGYDYETVNLKLSGDGSATLTEANGGNLTTGAGWGTTGDTINVTGTGDFEINIADSMLGGNATLGNEVAAKIDASGHTGALTVDLGVLETENVSAKNWTGVDSIKIQTDNTGGDQNQLVDVASGTEVIVAGIEAVDNLLTIDPNGSATGETLTVTLNHATKGSSIDITGLTTDGFETLTIKSTGTDSTSAAGVVTKVANVIDDVAGTSSDTTLNVSGDKKITLTGVEATFTTINVSNTLQTDLTVDAGGALTYTGGSGKDTLELDTLADITSADTLDGGGGSDTLQISDELATDFSTAQIATLSNFEVLEYTGAQDFSNNTGVAVDLTKLTGVNSLKFASTTTTDNASKLTVTASDGFVFTAAGVADGDSTAAANMIFTISGAADAGTDNTVTYNVLDAGAGDQTSTGFTIDNVENLIINLTGDGDADDADKMTFTDIDGAQLTKLTVASTNSGVSAANVLDSSDDLVITAVETTLLGTLDASAMTGAFTFQDVSAFISTGATITGGSGIDTITAGVGADTIKGMGGADIIVGGTGNDNIDGGAGADNITGSGGVDTLTGGAGSNTFVFADNDSDESTLDTIKDFKAGAADAEFDTLDITLATDTVFNTIAKASAHDITDLTTETETGTAKAYITNGIIALDGTQTSTVDTLAEWIDIAEDVAVNGYVDNTGNDAGAETVVAGFEFGGSTYVVFGDDGAADNTYATEGVFKLEGLTGVTAISRTEAANTIHVA